MGPSGISSARATSHSSRQTAGSAAGAATSAGAGATAVSMAATWARASSGLAASGSKNEARFPIQSAGIRFSVPKADGPGRAAILGPAGSAAGAATPPD